VTPHPAHRLLTRPSARGLAVAVAAIAALVMFCLQLSASNRATWRSVRQPGPASVDEALAAVCGSLALVLALWLLSALLISVLAALRPRSSAAVSGPLTSAAQVLAPKILRNAVAALLGVTIAAAPAAADATGGGSGSAPGLGAIHSSQELDHRVDLSPAWASTGHESAPGSSPGSDLRPGWTSATSSAAKRTGVESRARRNDIRRAGPEVSQSQRSQLPVTRAGPAHAESSQSGPTPGRPPRPGSTRMASSPTRPTQTEPTQTEPSQPEPIASGSTPGQYGLFVPTKPSRSRLPSSQPSGSTEHAMVSASRTSEARKKELAPMLSPAWRARADEDGEVVVRRGDTLWTLAERYLGPTATNSEIAVEWPLWFSANRAVIGNDPDHLVPGERLRPPERGSHSGPYSSSPTSAARNGESRPAGPETSSSPHVKSSGPVRARHRLRTTERSADQGLQPNTTVNGQFGGDW
jgi:nucleoid-associated protein YgaU